MNVHIRRMTVEDVPAVAQLDQLSFSLPWTERSFHFEVTSNPASRCWVAEQAGRIVGVVVAWLLVDEMHIATIATHPDFRRQGIAWALLAHVLKLGADEGALSSFLEVRESNLVAQAMYRKFGYEVTGRRPRYYKDNGEDAILMTLENLQDRVDTETGKQKSQ
ncbi:MAG TPA: ribosomal protein S18-alanine N-acetyltransferase [Anaerolineales bacterium]|nr:ribosomal protein S18-alanine N-acetyltransferase [Anaerolineales bacterium]